MLKFNKFTFCNCINLNFEIHNLLIQNLMKLNINLKNNFKESGVFMSFDWSNLSSNNDDDL